MSFGFPRFIRLSLMWMLAVFAGSGHPAAQPAQNDKKEATFSRHNGAVTSVAFSPDGKRLASAGDNEIKITDLGTGKEVMKLKGSRGMRFGSVAFSPDGGTLAGSQSMLKNTKSQRKGDTTITTMTFYGEVLVWDSQSGAIKAKLNDDNDPAWALAFSPDGKWLAVATGPTLENKDCKDICPAFGEIMLWETGGWKLIRRLRGGSAPIRALAFSPDSRLIAGGEASMNIGFGETLAEESRIEVFLWDAVTGELKQKFPGHTNSITSLAFAPDSSLLASASRDRTLRIWDCLSYELKKTASDHILSVEEIQTITDAAGDKSGKNAMPPVRWLNAIIFSRDGKQVIGGSGDSIIRFYDSESARIVGVLKPRGWPFFTMGPIRMSDSYINRPMTPYPNYPRLEEQRWSIERMNRQFRENNSLTSLALSPDGRTLAIGNSDGKIRLITLK